MLSQVRMRANKIDEPTARQSNVVQYTSEMNPIGHDEQPGESFREVAQMVQVHGQPAEKDLTGSGSVGSFVNLHTPLYAPQV